MEVFDPERYIREFERRMEKLFGEKFGKEIGIFNMQERATMNIAKEKGKLIYEIDLPGFKKDEISVEMEGDVLVVKAAKKTRKEKKGKDYMYQERSVASLQRAFTLPEDADTKKIKAHLEDGVLKIEVPLKKKRQHKHHIKITG